MGARQLLAEQALELIQGKLRLAQDGAKRAGGNIRGGMLDDYRQRSPGGAVSHGCHAG